MPDTELADLEQYTGLSPVEIEAAKTDLHMSTCPLQVWDCPDCARKLKKIRTVIAAVTPVIEEQKAAALVEQIVTTIEAYVPEAHPVICPPSVAYAAAQEKAVQIVRGFTA